MEQKKKEYVLPSMRVVKLRAQVVLQEVSDPDKEPNDSILGMAPTSCDTDRLA